MLILIASMLAVSGCIDCIEEEGYRKAVLLVTYSPSEPHPDDPLNSTALMDPEWREGTIEIKLHEELAPITTGRFIDLVEDGFLEGTIFHKVIEDLLIQGGDPDPDDPTVDGTRDPIDLEVHPELTHVDGAVGMARGPDPDSGDSQFYICDGRQHQLDDEERQNGIPPSRGYAVFGKVITGMDVVREIAEVWTAASTFDVVPEPIDDLLPIDEVLRTILTPTNMSVQAYRPIYNVTILGARIEEVEGTTCDDEDQGEEDSDICLPALVGIGLVSVGSIVYYLKKTVEHAGDIPRPRRRKGDDEEDVPWGRH